MTTRARATILLVLAALLFAAAATEDRRRETSFGRCLQGCEEDQPSYERARCMQECREQQQQRRREHDKHDDDRSSRDWRREGSSSVGDEDGEQESRGRPYVFGRRSFRRVVRSEQGFVKLLSPFHEASKLLRGLKDYRVAVLEANPGSFVVPSHTDAHCICYVAQGEGVLATIESGEKRSYAIRQGDIFVTPAGTMNYLANTDGRRKLVIAKILHTISVPGKLEFFFGGGGRNPESFLSSFSKRVQTAAFKTSEEKLEKLFGRQEKGVIIQASEQQLRELRRHASEGSHGPQWPLPPFGESRGPFNLLEQRPRIANQHGRLYVADARSFRDLAEHDIRVNFVNITAGSMNAPFYNTRSVKIAYVLAGEGEAEIVCPHLSSRRGGSEHGKGKWREEEEERDGQHKEEEEEVGQGYETVHARLSPGMAFVVPLGHPIVAVASRDSNLQIVCFNVHAENNDKVYLAGPNSVLKKLDAPAKELAFAASAREVDEVLDAQQEAGFVPGPEESGGRHKGDERHYHRRGRGEEAVETLLRMAAGAV